MKTLRLAVTLIALASSCKNAPPSPNDHRERDHHDEARAKEKSDLDRPVEELFSEECEHKKKTFECDECRYSVGVVRVPATLTEGGLLKTAEAKLQQIAVPVTLTGEVRFDERRVGHVSSQVEGVIKKVHVALGDQVKAGQALLEIESVTVGDAQASALEFEAMLELAQRNFERASELRKENISSEKEYLQARQEREAAEIRARGARGKLARLGTQGARGRLILRAPMDGTILVMHAVSGEVAKTEAPLVTVGDNSTLWVWADLYERDIAAVKRGQAVQKLIAAVSVKAYPGEEFSGVVDLVSPAMDESSRTVKVRIAAKNADGRLLAGMFATVKVFLPGTEKALAVPRDALLEDEGRAFVFIHHHGEFWVRRPVVPGRRWAELVEIRKGLEPVQIVAAEGAFLMKSDVLRSKMGAGCAD
jgi:cobalt-zinc-cadmium efflux system membrane fusion protein